jgi:LPPG:FO 2-phospho-L-lactate transferase
MKDVEVIALTGGVGGAKLALGLSLIVPDERLACLVNTADDFVHLGLHISPDLDTVLYTLAGCSNPDTGWGRRDETWTFMTVLQQLGGPTWFRIGDGDLALHVERTRRLTVGEPLTAVMADFAQRFGVRTRLLPMTEQSVRTRLLTDVGELEFQDYFVARRATPIVQRILYAGCEAARMPIPLVNALESPALRAIAICPSNPYLSIDPILAVPALRTRLMGRRIPVVAVCPVIGGQAIKGPTAKLMRELGVAVTPAAVAAHYDGILDGLVIDTADAAWADRCGLPVHVTATLMSTIDDRRRLAAETLEFAQRLARL